MDFVSYLGFNISVLGGRKLFCVDFRIQITSSGFRPLKTVPMQGSYASNTRWVLTAAFLMLHAKLQQLPRQLATIISRDQSK